MGRFFKDLGYYGGALAHIGLGPRALIAMHFIGAKKGSIEFLEITFFTYLNLGLPFSCLSLVERTF